MKDVAFVVRRPAIGSAKVRGGQISGALGADQVLLKELTPEIGRRYRILVYVKELPPAPLMKRLQDDGVVQVVDPLDNYKWRDIGRRAPYIDHFIGANHTHAAALTAKYGVRATRIPHHHVNQDELRIPPRREPPTMGYVGGRDHWPPVRRVLRNMPFPVVAHMHGAATLIEAYCSIDIGASYRKLEMKASYNSAVKLINFMSFGIPSVVTPESGYLEMSRHGEFCLFGQTVRECRMLLRELGSDPALRRRMGDAAFEAARPYHLRHIAEQYRELLESLRPA